MIKSSKKLILNALNLIFEICSMQVFCISHALFSFMINDEEKDENSQKAMKNDEDHQFKKYFEILFKKNIKRNNYKINAKIISNSPLNVNKSNQLNSQAGIDQNNQIDFNLNQTGSLSNKKCIKKDNNIELSEQNQISLDNLNQIACVKQTDKFINFPLLNTIIIITDIVQSTRLYIENPILMKESLQIHYKIVNLLVRKYFGHIVANEGDSFHLIFQRMEDSIGFCKDFFVQHKRYISYFKVRIGLNQGKFIARKVSGYELFGKCIEETLSLFGHNCGDAVCIKRSVLDKNHILTCPWICEH
jgi:hypothetical protein